MLSRTLSMTLAFVFLALLPVGILSANEQNPRKAARASITVKPFGHTEDDKTVDLYLLRNRRGIEAHVATWFTLDNTLHTDAINDDPNSLHGGARGFDKVVWNVDRADITAEGPQLTLSYVSKDGEEGYPGTLHVVARYTLTADNALRLQFTATTDKEPVVNLTQHSYFNLRGVALKGDVLDQGVMIDGDQFTPIDAAFIPTGELRSVAGTPFDFRKPTTIGARIEDSNEQLRFGKGYDHNWVIDGADGKLRLNATVYEPTTGRVLEVLSDQPGLQFYTGNMLDGTIVGKHGSRYPQHSGFCMELQHFPDSPNHPEFPSTTLAPGQIYQSTIVYRFSSKAAAS
jgi:aldose 1-epimerase